MTHDGDAYFTSRAHRSAHVLANTVVVHLAPADFLQLARCGEAVRKHVRASKDFHEHGGYNEIPYLKWANFGDGSARVTGHEGRHRSRSLEAAGVVSMPVRMICTSGETASVVPQWLIGQDARVTVAFPQPDVERGTEEKAGTPPKSALPIWHNRSAGLQPDESLRMGRVHLKRVLHLRGELDENTAEHLTQHYLANKHAVLSEKTGSFSFTDPKLGTAKIIKKKAAALNQTLGEVAEAEQTHPVPKDVQAAARQGLELRRKHGRGGIGPGQRRAGQLVSGKPMRHSTVMRCHRYFTRHEVDKKGKDWNNAARPSNGKIAWLLWGGDAGKRWAAGIAAKHKSEVTAQGETTPMHDFVSASIEAHCAAFKHNCVSQLVAATKPVEFKDFAEHSTKGKPQDCESNAKREYYHQKRLGNDPTYWNGRIVGTGMGGHTRHSAMPKGIRHAWVTVGDKIHDSTPFQHNGAYHSAKDYWHSAKYIGEKILTPKQIQKVEAELETAKAPLPRARTARVKHLVQRLAAECNFGGPERDAKRESNVRHVAYSYHSQQPMDPHTGHRLAAKLAAYGWRDAIPHPHGVSREAWTLVHPEHPGHTLKITNEAAPGGMHVAFTHLHRVAPHLAEVEIALPNSIFRSAKIQLHNTPEGQGAETNERRMAGTGHVARPIPIRNLQPVENEKQLGGLGFDAHARQRVAKISTAYKHSNKLPPVLTYKIPQDRAGFEAKHGIKLQPHATHLLIDGHHRVAGARMAGQHTVLHHELNSAEFLPHTASIETADTLRPLYVCRKLLNVGDLQRWAKANSLPKLDNDLHVTLLYSKTPADWMATPGAPPALTVPAGGPRAIDKFGKPGSETTVVLRFNHVSLQNRAKQLLDSGFSTDFPEYKAHITLFNDADNQVDHTALTPYNGPLEFGPESFGPVLTDAQIDEKRGRTSDTAALLPVNYSAIMARVQRWASDHSEEAGRPKSRLDLKERKALDVHYNGYHTLRMKQRDEGISPDEELQMNKHLEEKRRLEAKRDNKIWL